MEKHIKAGFIILASSIIALAILVTAFKVSGDSCQSLSCGSTREKAIVANKPYDWTTDDQIGKLIREAELPKDEKAQIVANVISKEVKRGNYTIRVGLEGRMKPIPHLAGNTKEERAKSLLDTVGIGYTLPVWKEFGEKYKIDYTLPIAIAFADSHLGKALKSKHNIGNIGNDDRGRTREFDSLEAGIEAIFWSLAHGKYMSGHNTIGTLSGEGRKRLGLKGCNEEKDYRKKCYATSMSVWSTNVTNCMSVIHDKQIDENFEFRTE